MLQAPPAVGLQATLDISSVLGFAFASSLVNEHGVQHTKNRDAAENVSDEFQVIHGDTVLVSPTG